MTEKKQKKNTIGKTIVKWFWIVSGCGVLIIALLFFLIAKGVIGYMPPIEDLENPIDIYASQVISSDMQNMGTFSRDKENRVYTSYSEIPTHLVEALMATEDARYLEHSGIDAYALARAVIKRLVFQNYNAGGGSTISQQLAKQLFTEETAQTVLERIFQKPIEWVIAVQLERYYTKEEIITMYLNKFDFLYNAIGIQSAAWVYFGKLPADLTYEEAAVLVAMLKNPTAYNPRMHPNNTLSRRNVVLSQMAKYGYITAAQSDSIQTLPLELDFHRASHNEGIAPYFREYLRIIMMAKKPERKNYQSQLTYAEDSVAWESDPLYGWCHKNKKADGSPYNISTDGLKIYTTINATMQKYAEEAVEEHIGDYLQKEFFKSKARSSTAPYSSDLKKSEVDAILERTKKQTDRYRALKKDNISDEEIDKVFKTPVDMTVFSWAGTKDTTMTPMDSIRYMKSFLRTGFMTMDPRSGAVKTYVGGINYYYFKYDMVSKGKRQVGSTIKPFLYSLAMESGMTPCDLAPHYQQTYYDEVGNPWTPQSSNKERIGEMVTLGWGLKKSDNWISAWIMDQLSPYAFKRLLEEGYGLTGQIDPVISLCLGPCEVSVKEMVSGFSTFANGGLRTRPMMVTRIEDRNGNVVATFEPRMKEVISEKSAYRMLSMLQEVIAPEGTGYRMRFRYNLKVPMGGKTGTTQNHSDGWFIGFTPSLVGGVWVGGEERSIRFDRMSEGQGANMSLPIMGLFLQKVFKDKTLGYSEEDSFNIPEQYLNPCATNEVNFDQTDPAQATGELDEFFN